ncbi:MULTISPECIES: hypothetical protein [unclassified Dietzia]|uniref:hypothetical protein n=2 Tax=Dietzia TaxID=37914 RepID=UPI000D229BAA|nr:MULTISPECIES: hypothetical protein [unclassified Dietzia]AVZ39158.1 hypothetical protein CT688_06430 [Dietzia sp. JS16-p6b]QGW24375.1 hypothetical protein GJR88_02061 [Dietzia sp. DQ12-45-1b]
MTSTIDTADPADSSDTRRAPTAPTGRPPGVGAVGLRRKPVTRSVRGRRTVVVPAERLSPAELAGRIPFVVVMLLLIGTGVGGTLLLSAQTTQDTYDLKNARDANVELVERMEALRASNERARSAEVLAQRAEKLGMVGVASAPILTRGSDGVIEVVGEPEATLGAPVRPLQPAPVGSEPSTSPERGGFDAPPAQVPQDRTPRGVAPVPYPPLAGRPVPAAPPAPMEEPSGPAPAVAPDPPAPVPAPGGEVATLAPVPGPLY